MHIFRTFFCILLISFYSTISVRANEINDFMIDFTIDQLNCIYKHNEYLDSKGICEGKIYHVDMNAIVYGKPTMGSKHDAMVSELSRTNAIEETGKRKLYVLFTAYYSLAKATLESPTLVEAYENNFKNALKQKAYILAENSDRGTNNPGILFWAASELNNTIFEAGATPRAVGNTHNKCGIILGHGMGSESMYNTLNALRPYFKPISGDIFSVWALNTITSIGTLIREGSLTANTVVIANAQSKLYRPSQLAWDERLKGSTYVQQGDPKIWDEAGLMTATEEQELIRDLTASGKKFKIYTSSQKYNLSNDVRNLNLQSKTGDSQGTFGGLEKNAIQRLYEYTGIQDGEIALALHFDSGVEQGIDNILYWDVRIGNQLADVQTKQFVRTYFIDSLFGRLSGANIEKILYNCFTGNATFFDDVPHKVAAIRSLLVGGLINSEESKVITILSQTANKDIPLLIESLKAYNCDLLYDIIDNTHDATMGWGDDNYGKLMQELSNLLTRDPETVKSFNNASDEELINRTILWHDSQLFSDDFLGKNTYNVKRVSNNNNITYERTVTTVYYKSSGAKDEAGLSLLTHRQTFPAITPLNPLDLVMFFDCSNMSIVSDALPTQSEIKLVPAIFLEYAQKKAFNEDISTVIGLVGDGLTLVSGPGLITKAGRVMRVIIGIEMSGAVGNILIQISDIGPEYDGLVNAYNLTMGIVGLTSLASDFPGAIRSTNGLINNARKATTKNFLAQVARFEAVLLDMAKTKPKAGDILKLRSFIKEEWVRRFPGEVIDANTYKTLGAVNSVSVVNSLKKLVGKASSENILWKNLDDANIIWANPNNNVLSTAKSFVNETGISLYDLVLSNGYYVKFDLNDGRILLGNTNGNYHAFGVLNNADLSVFKSSVLNVDDEVFNTKLFQLLSTNSDKLKVISGIVSKQLTIAGKTVTLNSNKVNTMLGRFRPDIANLFDELSSFKNVGLGETKGGINILNKPDYYYDPSSWWNAYNKPWLDKAITRGDDIFLTTIPTRSDDLIDALGNLKGAYSQELDLLATRNYKPINISEEIWFDIKYWLRKPYVKNGARLEEVAINNAFETHIKVVEKISRDGLSGGHLEIAFKNASLPNVGKRIEIVSETPKAGIEGVKDIQYKVLAEDAKGNVVQGQYIQKQGSDRIFIKTVYDPNVYSDKLMKELGAKAFKDAMENNAFNNIDNSFSGMANGRRIVGHYEVVNGEKIPRTWWIEH